MEMQKQMIVIKNVQLIDGTGCEPEINKCVIIKDGLIERIEENCEDFDDALVIEGKGKTLMPGMIDCHVHLDLGDNLDIPGVMLEESLPLFVIRANERLNRYLPAGFTTLRVNGGHEHLATALRDAVDMEIIRGPRIIAAGKYLSITGGHGQFFKTWVKTSYSMVDMVDGPEEIRKAVRTQITNGVDVIKFFNTGGVMDSSSNPNGQEFTDEEIQMVVSEAKRGGKRTSTHAHGTMGIKSAIRAGVDSIEHASILDEECVDLLKNSDSYIVPTLSAVHWIIEKGDELGLPDYVMDKARALKDKVYKSFDMALKANVNIAMGTDSGTPYNFHGNNAIELELMVDAGMTPLEAIKTATHNAAENLGILEFTGTIEVGKLADLILVDGDPIEDISLLQEKEKIELVIKEGVIEVDRLK
jgi:imidazolonepropionase-like amidohydrolase